MPRIRTIKPEFWANEDLAMLDPNAKLLAIALLNYCDDEGYFKAHPSLIKSFAFPFDEQSTNIPKLLESLCEVGYISLYKCTYGKKYGYINNFTKHQRVDRPKASEIATLELFDEHSTNHQGQVDAGKERKGKERKGTGKGKEEPDFRYSRKVALPKNFYLTDKMKSFYQNKGYTLPIEETTEKWLNYIKRENRKFADWYAAWQNGMAKAHEFDLQRQAKVINHRQKLSAGENARRLLEGSAS